MGMKSVGGEIVQVQGGHIVRSTGRKDRHSKVYTAKGPRDRRVRLSAHTAIQFYDVQDRLGYDRPSKAVDWLIKKAKIAIDKLAELPPWHPTGVAATATEGEAPNGAGTSEMVISAEQSESSGYNFQLQRQIGDNTDHNDSNFIPQSLDSDTIADTMKSFFPTSSAASTINFQSYPSDIISRTTNLNPNQDLGLSLHSFQDQGLIHHTQQSHQDTTHHHNDQIQTLFAVPATAGFDSSTYQRMVAWSSDTSSHENNNRGLFFNNMSALPHQQQQALMGQQQQQHSSAFAQRGTLQSSFTPSIRSWSDEIQMASQRTQHPIHHSSIFGTRFASDGLPVFCIPTTRIHGEDADNAVVSDRPSSTSSPNSNHHSKPTSSFPNCAN